MPPIADGYKKNFETLLNAARHGDLCALDVRRKSDGKSVVAVCAINKSKQDEVEFVPLAVMVEGDPYEMYDPPKPGGGYIGRRK